MNHKHNQILKAILVITMLTSSTVSTAQAGESKEKEAKEFLLFNQAKISLTEAIKAAEQKTGGNAIEAEIDDESHTVQFEIEILKDGKIHEVIVDGKTGKVLKVSLDDEANDSDEKNKD